MTVILVGKLHERASELRKVVVDEIGQLVTGEHGLLLKNLHVADGVEIFSVHAPKSRVTQKVGVVMKKTGRAYDLSVGTALHIDNLSRL